LINIEKYWNYTEEELEALETNQEQIKEMLIATKKLKLLFQKHPKIFTWGFI